jgi:hypothetical protein
MINLTKKFKKPENPYLLFFPFLLLYVIFVLLIQTEPLFGDEPDYIMYAQNLIHGFYSPPPPDIYLRNGPGYPLLIAPFVALKIPFLYIKLLNPLFHYLSIVFLFKALKQIASLRIAFIVSIFWALYYNSFDFMPRMYSEIFSSFLISLIILLILKAFEEGKSQKENKYILYSGFVLGYLVLTKVIFGYVLLSMLFGFGIFWLFNRTLALYRKSMFILLIALATTLPYLAYTYHLTGRFFYWASTGGNNLYWMSSPNKNEYGNWFRDLTLDTVPPTGESSVNGSKIGGSLDMKNRNNDIPGKMDSVRFHHLKDFEEIYKYTGIAQDDQYKKIAIRNIKANPLKFVQNCFSNIGRILFNYPYSYTIQKPGTLLRFPLNMIILVFMLISVIPTFLNWRKIIFPIRFLLFFSFLYLGGSVLGSAEIRMFTIISPMLLFWIAYILNRSVILNFRFSDIK